MLRRATAAGAAQRVRRLHINAARGARVLVVGGGPVGLAMGFLLDRVFGVSARVVDRQAQPTTHPQAHFLNLRTMEVLQSAMPAFHDRLLEHAAPSELWRDYIYTTGIGKAREFARIDQFGDCIPRPLKSKQELLDALSGLSPTQFLHFPQNRFENMLSAFVEEKGLRVEREVELVDLQRDGNGKRSHVKLRHLRSQRVEEASFDYVIGADGAHSLVRQLSGIDMVGTRNLQSIVNVHFTSKTLSRAARENPAMLSFVFNEHVIAVLIAHDLNNGEWVAQIPFFPPQESIEQDFSVDQCKAIVKHLLSDKSSIPEDDISILSVGQWQMSARVAKQYDVDNRIFLVGDAAHQFPPAGGFGMNTGIQDAHNLAWKLAWSIQAEESGKLPVDAGTLLRSYERERQLTAKLNTQLSLRNVERTMKIPSALNVSHNNAKILASIVNSAPVKYLPLVLQRDTIQGIMALGKKPLSLLDTKNSALGERMRRHVQDIVAKRSSLGMLFYHFDIGFSYDTSTWGKRARELMQDSALDLSAEFTTTERAAADVYKPEFSVGVRFPHLWCSLNDSTHRVSTISLPDLTRERIGDQAVRFVLVVDGNQIPAQVLNQLGDLISRHVAIVSLSSIQQDLPRHLSSPTMNLVVNPDSLPLWNEFTRSYVATLVRPDGHIAALFGPNADNLTASALRSAMQCH